MAIQAVVGDIPVKVRCRVATFSVRPGHGISIAFKSSGTTFDIAEDDISSVVVRKDCIAYIVKDKLHDFAGLRRSVDNFIIPAGAGYEQWDHWNNALEAALQHACATDTREVDIVKTACDRYELQVVPGKQSEAYVWDACSCTCVPHIDMAVLQRTQGGMSTYDVHLLHHDNEAVTTVEMLPHSTLSMWAERVGEDHMYDLGPDPVSPVHLSLLYRETGCWKEVLKACADDMQNSESDESMSEYDDNAISEDSSSESEISVFSSDEDDYVSPS